MEDENKKYKILDSSFGEWGTLRRIQALKDFGDVVKGDIGGFILTESNLSQEGNCWVYNDAKVWGNAVVKGNARIRHESRIYSTAIVKGNAIVGDRAAISDGAVVKDNAKIYGDASINGNSIISGSALVRDHANIWGYARINGYSVVSERAQVYENSEVTGLARVCGKARVSGRAEIYNSIISGNAEISGNAVIKHPSDYLVFENNWSSFRSFTWTRSNDKWIVGCFYGTGEELIAKAYKDDREKGDRYALFVELVEKMKELDKK